MLIDWFTLIAQIINFVILVWLLKRFLYKPVLQAMDAREKKIADQLRDAAAQKAEAEKQQESFRVAQEEFAKQKQNLLNGVEEEAAAARQRLMEEIRDEVQTLRRNWREALHEEQTTFRTQLADSVQHEIFAIARQTLRDLAGAELEQQIATRFLGRLSQLDGNEKAQIAAHLKTSRRPLVIRSAFDLPDPVRVNIEHAVCNSLEINVPIRFETTPEVLSGIELGADGHKVSWSINGYLSSLEDSVGQLVEQTAANHEEFGQSA